ncbi:MULTISPECIES: EF-hand domain-containing protein [Nocardiopsis]|uniref:Ca2+-binding EF-hand superfamily protein n=1 Tax=Nocardiopsis sinuspersici TaxID=501010 RepID=A0A1V3BY01_9ACTN|nr:MULTISPECIES: EF-hand domain-containing protein [Nocardiopsis]NYH54659.1 Ca2+-binding EF-hand superfamily protein [Nocardiopsis sinuspersici]OOC53437.1 signal transduction protein [Nocardiopsis sinuspersici]
MTTATKANSRLEERFRLWDNNGNGAIERSDFENEANGIISRLGAEGTAKGNALREAYLGMFDQLAAAAGSQRMTKDQFVRVAEQKIIGRGDAGFAEIVQPTIQAIVDVLDVDGSGEISPSEMEKWFDAIGLGGAEATRAFSELDTDGSGRLSTAELVAAVRDYHLGKNDIPLLGG